MFYSLCLDCLLILRIFAFLIICVSILKPNISCRMSVNSFLVYVDIYSYDSSVHTSPFMFSVFLPLCTYFLTLLPRFDKSITRRSKLGNIPVY